MTDLQQNKINSNENLCLVVGCENEPLLLRSDGRESSDDSNKPKENGCHISNDPNEVHQRFMTVSKNVKDYPVDSGYSFVIIFIGFLVQFIILGFGNNVGMWIVKWENSFPNQQAVIALSSTMIFGMTFFMAPVSAFLAENIGCRFLGITGCVIAAFSIIISSFATNAYYFLFTFGVFYGVGSSFMYFSSIMIIPSYFQKFRAMANGCVVSGSGIGTFILSMVLPYFLENDHWSKLIRVYGFVLLLLIAAMIFLVPRGLEFCPCNFIVRPRDQKKYSSLIFFLSRFKKTFLCYVKNFIFKNPRYFALAAAYILFMLGYIAPFLFLKEYAIQVFHRGCKEAMLTPEHSAKALTSRLIEHCQGSKEPKLPSLLIGIFSLCSSFSKIVSGVIVSHFRLNSIPIIQIAFLLMGISYSIIPLINNMNVLIVPSIISGICEGIYFALVISSVEVVNGDNSLNAAVGILFSLKSIPLIGSGYLLGFIYKSSNSYDLPFYISGGCIILSSIVMISVYFVPKTEIDILQSVDDNKIPIISDVEKEENMGHQTL